MKAILVREIKSFFGSLIGYLVIAVFLVLNGLFLWIFDGQYNILQSGYNDLAPFFRTQTRHDRTFGNQTFKFVANCKRQIFRCFSIGYHRDFTNTFIHFCFKSVRISARKYGFRKYFRFVSWFVVFNSSLHKCRDFLFVAFR